MNITYNEADFKVGDKFLAEYKGKEYCFMIARFLEQSDNGKVHTCYVAVQLTDSDRAGLGRITTNGIFTVFPKDEQPCTSIDELLNNFRKNQYKNIRKV